jgi:S-adenosylmethionine hydrolase
VATSPSSRPLITLTSDFGTRDYYAAAMKASIIRHCPEARLIDVTHEVPRHDILCGSITLERAVDGFLPGTVHLAVVDPGVGTDRRILLTELNRQTVVCPDNGLITWAWQRLGPGTAYELTWRPAASSTTFHGRDIMGPAAAMIASGRAIAELARPISDPILLDLSPADSSARKAKIIHVDQFGNATTNMAYDVFKGFGDPVIFAGGQTVGKLRRTYWDVMPGKAIALIGSSGLLEIAVRDGSAAEKLGIKVGDEIRLE